MYGRYDRRLVEWYVTDMTFDAIDVQMSDYLWTRSWVVTWHFSSAFRADQIENHMESLSMVNEQEWRRF